MKDRLMRVLTLVSAVAALALAGGASLRGFYDAASVLKSCSSVRRTG